MPALPRYGSVRYHRRALRQGHGLRGCIPAAAQGADQAHGGRLLGRAHLQGLALAAQFAAARIQQLKLAHQAIAVA